MSRVLLATLSFFLVLEAAAASAQTVAVAPFEGRRSAAVERLVGRALSDRAEVVSRSDVRAAARRAGVSGTDAAGVEALASDVGAQIVVQGSVSGPRRRPRVELVFRAADGFELARGQSQVSRGRRGQRGARVQALPSAPLQKKGLPLRCLEGPIPRGHRGDARRRRRR